MSHRNGMVQPLDLKHFYILSRLRWFINFSRVFFFFLSSFRFVFHCHHFKSCLILRLIFFTLEFVFVFFPTILLVCVNAIPWQLFDVAPKLLMDFSRISVDSHQLLTIRMTFLFPFSHFLMIMGLNSFHYPVFRYSSIWRISRQ